MSILESVSISDRRLNSMAVADSLPAELRACVHEFGLGIVDACRQAGVTNPRRIRVLVREIWAGARQPGQRSTTLGTLDWLLIQAGAEITAERLIWLLGENNMIVCPVEPSREMLDASLATVSGHTVLCTKEEKHRRRLRAALRAALAKNMQRAAA